MKKKNKKKKNLRHKKKKKSVNGHDASRDDRDPFDGSGGATRAHTKSKYKGPVRKWTEEEDSALRRLYPDVRDMASAFEILTTEDELQHRTAEQVVYLPSRRAAPTPSSWENFFFFFLAHNFSVFFFWKTPFLSVLFFVETPTV